MDQDVLVEAVGEHVSTIEAMVFAAVALVAAGLWAGLTRKEEVQAMGISIERRYAAWVFAGLFCVINAGTLLLIIRLDSLLTLVDEEHLPAALTKLTSHSWALNPFAYYGQNFLAVIQASVSFAILIGVWFLCISALNALSPWPTSRQAPFLFNMLTLLLMVFGVYSLISIHTVFDHLEERARPDAFAYLSPMWSFNPRTIGAIAGYVFGFSSLGAIRKAKRRMHLEEAAQVLKAAAARVSVKSNP